MMRSPENHFIAAGLARCVSCLQRQTFGALFIVTSLLQVSAQLPAGAAKTASSGPGQYVLITPLQSNETWLLDPQGKECHRWTSTYRAAAGARMQHDGSILRLAIEKPAKTFRNLGVTGGRVQHLSWNGGVLWDFWNAATHHMVCGDALLLPNGHVLMAVAEYKSRNDAIQLGRRPETVSETGLYAPGLMEFKPEGKNGGRLIWRWSAWDHVVQSHDAERPNFSQITSVAHSRRLDINTGLPSPGVACSELSYSAEHDVILMTLPDVGEIWLVDHSTTTAEAGTDKGGKKRYGGDLLWRWNAEQEAGAPIMRVLSAQLASEPVEPDQGTPLAIHLLASVSSGGSVQHLCLQKISLPIEAKDSAATAPAFQHTVSDQVIHPWSPLASEDKTNPTVWLDAVDQDPRSFYLLTHPLQGSCELVSRGEVSWSFQLDSKTSSARAEWRRVNHDEKGGGIKERILASKRPQPVGPPPLLGRVRGYQQAPTSSKAP